MVQLPSIKLLIENILTHYCNIKRPVIGSLKHFIVQTTLHSITLCLKLVLHTLYMITLNHNFGETTYIAYYSSFGIEPQRLYSTNHLTQHYIMSQNGTTTFN